MKKIILLMLFLVTVSIRCFGLSETAILLHHGDDVTVYEGASQLQAALDAAEDGDILYLSPGSYAGFEITKRIHIKGSGADKTVIRDCVWLNIDSDEDEPVVFTEPVLEGVTITGIEGFILSQYTDGVTIKQCKIPNFTVLSGFHVTVALDDTEITERFDLSDDVKITNLSNCRINNFYNRRGNSPDVTLWHCTINTVYSPNNFDGTIVNSIIFGGGSSDNTFRKGEFKNTGLRGVRLATDVVSENIYNLNDSEWWWQYEYHNLDPADPARCDRTEILLWEDGFKATDNGTIGGIPWFNLPGAIDEANSKIEVDNEARELNATIKLSRANN